MVPIPTFLTVLIPTRSVAQVPPAPTATSIVTTPLESDNETISDVLETIEVTTPAEEIFTFSHSPEED